MKQREATISRSGMTDGFGPPQVLLPLTPFLLPSRMDSLRPANETKSVVLLDEEWDDEQLNDSGGPVVFIKILVSCHA